MKANKLWGALLAGMVGLAMTTSPTDVEAQAKKSKAAAAPAGPAVTKKDIVLEPAGLSWGMTSKQVMTWADKVIDEDFKPQYAKVSRGSVREKELDSNVLEEKDTFRRSKLVLDKLMPALDNGPLRGEYSYFNKEVIYSLSRQGQTRHFFFIQDKLWKFIDEIKFSDKGPIGKNFLEAAGKLSGNYGVPGHVIPANEDAGIFITVVDWKDTKTHVRLIERSEAAAAVAYTDLATLANIDNLRTNKPKQEDAIDPAVAAAIRGDSPPDPKANDKKK